jgi:hypothetical protein
MLDERLVTATAEPEFAPLFAPRAGCPEFQRNYSAGCPEFQRDYVRLAAWVFAVLFGPALAAMAVLLFS